MKRWPLIVAVVFAMACSGTVKRTVSLEERVGEYWRAVVKQDFVRAYGYEYPLYRKVVSLNTYIAQRAGGVIKIKGFEVKGVEKKEDRAVVKMKLDIFVKPPFAKSGVEVHPERKDLWIRVDGVWYHVPKDYERLRGMK